eukprot:CAMPEP_0172496952 /NCGR_PEP_ID=MMETSP1066-20121228/94707_1 /TAXON_ID=671091 /ORGANISM="Coscinodiscus wailesii, Strain CCMP2513" /LENGTH=741 /DNA_ID=CAMNT_0013269509 /DNA_START=71 /DNA_END=2296 /DNA_ORIENTATION=-
MEQLIPIAAKLQDVLGALGHNTTLNLPQIIVIGGQSSGKSSVLEGVVGRSFLPRGSGIVTRRPLILQLFNTSSSSSSADGSDNDAALPEDEWGEFLHQPGKRYYDFDEIRKEIVNDTERLVGSNKGISPNPINLKIYSPKVLHLTLVDLPGITKCPVGDQPQDIESQIRNMCLRYVTNPNAIILAVTAGNTDLANSDALKMAREVDPSGERTIGVLTKLDLMDMGTDAADILSNKLIPLRRGYVGVVNRGQLDVQKNVAIGDGLKKEEEFFMTHPAYRSLAHRCGTANLAKSLNGILMHHIRDCLPELKSRIVSMMGDLQHDLEALGHPATDSSKTTLGASLLGLLSKFTVNFSDCIDGRGSSPDGIEMNELFGGARVAFIFNEVFVRSLMAIEPFDGLSDDEIRTTICNANGTRQSLFVPEISFELLVKRQISRLEQPGLQCVDLVFDELQRMASQCEPSEFTRFPNLRERLVEVVGRLLKRCVTPTQLMVSNLIKIELAYINTSHPDFIGGSKAVAKLMEKMSQGEEEKKEPSVNASQYSHAPRNNVAATAQTPNTDIDSDSNASFDTPDKNTPLSTDYINSNDTNGGGLMNFIFGSNPSKNKPLTTSIIRNQSSVGPPTIVQLPQVPDTMRCPTFQPTDREKIETEIIKSLIESYFSIVRKNFNDMVPKTIMYFLVNHARDSMQNELVTELYRDNLVVDLMKEADDIAQRRKTCREMKDLLGKAMEIVNEVRDFNTFK